MTPPNRRLPVLLMAALLIAACGGEPLVTAAPSVVHATATPPALPAVNERPFAPAAWPASGSACAGGEPGAATAGSGPGAATAGIGRIEALSERVVRFTLCAPDGAFLARLAHPALGIIDASSVDLVARDPSAARWVPGAGAYRVDGWTPGENIRLVQAAAPAADGSPAPSAKPSAGASASTTAGGPPTIILRWADDPAARTTALREAAVDGIDAPGATDIADLGTLPEIAVLPRPGLATAYLGFGTGRGLGSTAVRRAFAEAIDTTALARDAFPAGSVVATHTAPCDVAGGCAGADWYEFNGPDATAALQAARFDLKTPIPLHIPDAAVPGLPDPAGVAAVVRDQLLASIGVTVAVDVVPAAQLANTIASGRVDGLYLDGVGSSLADASGFLQPLFGEGATGVAAGRAKGVPEALAAAATAVDAGARIETLGRANDAVKATAPIVPLVHPGSTAAYRADVAGVAISPMGVDPLGTFVPADRHQLVVMQPSEPAGAWCGVGSDPGMLRLCELVTPGLYAFDGASLKPVPSLASRCTPTDGAQVWTCRLRTGLRFTDGKHVDAGDVLASLQALADPTSALRASLPASSFAAWDALFGSPTEAAPIPTTAPGSGPPPGPATTSPGPATGSPGPAGTSPASAGTSRAPSPTPAATGSPAPSPTH
jgi:peptide/nickel transport system substrate-binding protein